MLKSVGGIVERGAGNSEELYAMANRLFCMFVDVYVEGRGVEICMYVTRAEL